MGSPAVTAMLEAFTQKYRMFGEQLVAAEMLSWRNDKHCGQWLVLHVPFARLAQFQRPEIGQLVPEQHKYLAMALRCAHPAAKALWCEEAALREALRSEGHGRNYIADVVEQLMADAQLVHGYLNGTIKKTNILTVEQALVTPSSRRFASQAQWEHFIKVGQKTVEGRIDDKEAAKVQTGDIITLGSTRVLVREVTHHRSFRDMLEQHTVAAALPGVNSIPDGVKVYHQFKTTRG